MIWHMHLAHEIIDSSPKSADRFAGSADALVRTERAARTSLTDFFLDRLEPRA